MSQPVHFTGTVTDDFGQGFGVDLTGTLYAAPTAAAVTPAEIPELGGRLTFTAVSDRPLTWEMVADSGTLTPVDGSPGVYDYTPA